MTNPSYFSILTADVRYSKELTDFEKLLFSEISALSQKHGYCTASNAYFAELYGKAKETVSRSISKMAKLKFLNVEEVRNDKKEVVLRKIYMVTAPKNEYYPIDENINTPIDENIKPLLTNLSIGIDENVKENNPRINNTRIHTPLPPNLADETHDCANALVAADATTGGGDLENLADNADKPLNPASLAESANNAAAHSGSPKRKAIAPVPVQQILQTYNEVLGDKLPKAQLLNDKRRRVIAGRWKEMLNSQDPSGKVRFTDTASGLAWFAKFFAKVALNPHWLGENDRGWRADLDWILKPDNFLRILEWRPK